MRRSSKKQSKSTPPWLKMPSRYEETFMTQAPLGSYLFLPLCSVHTYPLALDRQHIWNLHPLHVSTCRHLRTPDFTCFGSSGTENRINCVNGPFQVMYLVFPGSFRMVRALRRCGGGVVGWCMRLHGAGQSSGHGASLPEPTPLINHRSLFHRYNLLH